jgi:hypothetical protein
MVFFPHEAVCRGKLQHLGLTKRCEKTNKRKSPHPNVRCCTFPELEGGPEGWFFVHEQICNEENLKEFFNFFVEQCLENEAVPGQ